MSTRPYQGGTLFNRNNICVSQFYLLMVIRPAKNVWYFSRLYSPIKSLQWTESASHLCRIRALSSNHPPIGHLLGLDYIYFIIICVGRPIVVVMYLLYRRRRRSISHSVCLRQKNRFDTILIWIILWIIDDVLSRFNVNDFFLLGFGFCLEPDSSLSFCIRSYSLNIYEHFDCREMARKMNYFLLFDHLFFCFSQFIWTLLATFHFDSGSD